MGQVVEHQHYLIDLDVTIVRIPERDLELLARLRHGEPLPALPERRVAVRALLHAVNVRVVGDEVGQASSIKMIRSVMVKGIEALTAEMIAAAEAAGVADEVLASLDASEKASPWAQKAAYNLERMHTHGVRRAAEMEESAKTLLSLGVAPVMTRGTIYRQRQAAEKGSEA